MKRVTWKIYFIGLGIWLGITVFVDFVAVPTLFSNVSSRYEAGRVGMILFTTFNKIEVTLSLLLLGFAFLFWERVLWKKTVFGLLGLLVILAMSYTFYLSPKIVELTEKMQTVVPESRAYQLWDKDHQFFHRTYIKLDSLKLLLLLVLMIVPLQKNQDLRS